MDYMLQICGQDSLSFSIKAAFVVFARGRSCGCASIYYVAICITVLCNQYEVRKMLTNVLISCVFSVMAV